MHKPRADSKRRPSRIEDINVSLIRLLHARARAAVGPPSRAVGRPIFCGRMGMPVANKVDVACPIKSDELFRPFFREVPNSQELSSSRKSKVNLRKSQETWRNLGFREATFSRLCSGRRRPARRRSCREILVLTFVSANLHSDSAYAPACALTGPPR
jgi:hypothetical protein